MSRNFILILILILLVGGCTQSAQSTGKIDIYFCPFADCTAVYSQLIASGKSYCAFYALTDKSIITAFQDDKLIIDEDAPSYSFSQTRKGNGLMHNKYCIINESVVITGSFNPTLAGKKDFNNILVIHSKPLAEQYMNSYRQLLEPTKKLSTTTRFIHNGKPLEAYHCPQDDCQRRVLLELAKAKESISFALFTFTDHDVSNLLLEKMRGGVVLSGVIESYQQPKYNQYFPLKKAGADIVLDNLSVLQHNKLFIIDNKTVITGSYNPTKAAYSINDENIVVLHDETIAKTYAAYVQYLTQMFK